MALLLALRASTHESDKLRDILGTNSVSDLTFFVTLGLPIPAITPQAM
jgi:hypothetical protein